jgi:hypothetical protein
MIDGIAHLWNWLTGGKVNPTQEYVENFFSILDFKKEGKISK